MKIAGLGDPLEISKPGIFRLYTLKLNKFFCLVGWFNNEKFQKIGSMRSQFKCLNLRETVINYNHDNPYVLILIGVPAVLEFYHVS